MYQFSSIELSDTDHGFEEQCRLSYESKQRPLCLCKRPGVEMYLARFEDRHIIKRMPGSGALHDTSCEHFEAPASLSGMGNVLGTAIKGQPDGTTLLRLDFSLTKSTGRSAPTPSENPAQSVKAEPAKLTLVGLLHYLWHEADLDRWMPKFDGRRRWGMIRARLLDGIANASAKKTPILDRLYIPETFSLDNKDVIQQRRHSFLGKYRSSDQRKRELIVILAEIKEIEPARYNFKLKIKHAPDFPIFVHEQTYARLKKRYSTELAMWQAYEDCHLMMIATASVSEANAATVEEIALMFVDKNWIPIESADEMALIENLTSTKRSFVKGLHYSVQKRPLASALMTDTNPPTGMFVVSSGTDGPFDDLIEGISKETKLPVWVWKVDDGAWPAIPPINV